MSIHSDYAPKCTNCNIPVDTGLDPWLCLLCEATYPKREDGTRWYTVDVQCDSVYFEGTTWHRCLRRKNHKTEYHYNRSYGLTWQSSMSNVHRVGSPKYIEMISKMAPIPETALELMRLERLESYLHSRCLHPDYEYAITEGQRKSWDGVNDPPLGDNGETQEGWVRNVHKGRKGWERLDYTEESYWMRIKPPEPEVVEEDEEKDSLTEDEMRNYKPVIYTASEGFDIIHLNCGYSLGVDDHGDFFDILEAVNHHKCHKNKDNK